LGRALEHSWSTWDRKPSTGAGSEPPEHLRWPLLKAGMTPDELLECILNDAQLLELVAAVIAAAAETGLQTKTSFRSLGVVCHDPAP
jgi:hypothetical protein